MSPCQCLLSVPQICVHSHWTFPHWHRYNYAQVQMCVQGMQAVSFSHKCVQSFNKFKLEPAMRVSERVLGMHSTKLKAMELLRNGIHIDAADCIQITHYAEKSSPQDPWASEPSQKSRLPACANNRRASHTAQHPSRSTPICSYI